MSMIKHNIFLYPSQCDIPCDENLQQGGFRCPTCAGEGTLRDYFDNDQVKRCKRCHGTGRLVAEITIKWRPDDSAATT